MPHPLSGPSALVSASTPELIDELKRRSLGLLLVCVRVEEDGDEWRYALKGSLVLLGAMGAALEMETRRHLSGGDEEAVRT